MRISFACPSCNASGSADSAYVGREVRCKHCNTRFTIRDPESSEPDIYALEEPETPAASRAFMAPGGGESEPGAVFVPARTDERPERPRSRAKAPAAKAGRRRGRDLSDIPWTRWLIRVAIAFSLVVAGIALIAPNGLWLAGCILMGTGGLLVLLGHFGGAYVAFTEDFVYGVLFLAIPIYTAYYIVTNWDEMWVFFACSTVGAGLAAVGITLVERAATTALV